MVISIPFTQNRAVNFHLKIGEVLTGYKQADVIISDFHKLCMYKNSFYSLYDLYLLIDLDVNLVVDIQV